MNLSLFSTLTTDLITDEDLILEDEELTAYLDDLYDPKALKRDRIKRFRNQ